MILHGYDVSHHQPPGSVPWKGASFAMARVTMGAAGIDTHGWTHLHQAYAVAVPVLVAYHYLRGDSPGVAQARRFLDRVDALDESLGLVGLMVDVENPDKPNPPWHIPTYRTALLDFLAHVRAQTSRRCLIYGPGAYLPLLTLPAEVADLHPLHLADWHPPYPVPAPWTIITIHQHKVAEVGAIKLDHNRFEGTVEDLRRVLGLDVPSPIDAQLGALADAVRAAEGRGENVQHFVPSDEGPRIPGGS